MSLAKELGLGGALSRHEKYFGIEVKCDVPRSARHCVDFQVQMRYRYSSSRGVFGGDHGSRKGQRVPGGHGCPECPLVDEGRRRYLSLDRLDARPSWTGPTSALIQQDSPNALDTPPIEVLDRGNRADRSVKTRATALAIRDRSGDPSPPSSRVRRTGTPESDS